MNVYPVYEIRGNQIFESPWKQAAEKPVPPRPDIHWENNSEGAHYARPDGSCCR